MSRYHLLTLKKVQQETPDAVSLSFEIPAHLKPSFSYIQGQYVNLKLQIDGKEVVRSYSICSSSFTDEHLSVAVKRVNGGLASNFINEHLKAGDRIEVMEPMGNFHTPLNPDNQNNYLLFAGGSGITPMLSIIKSVLAVEKNSSLYLIYGNRDLQSIIFHEQLKELSAANDCLHLIHVLDNPSGASNAYQGPMKVGTIENILQERLSSVLANSISFICGPEPMMLASKEALLKKGVADTHIKIEYFTAKSDAEKHAESVGADNAAEKITEGNAHVTIKYDGNEYQFDMNVKEKVVDAALDAGFDPPYSCLVAACCTCRAKLKSGLVEMEDRESLTDEEIEDGYVLACQAHPRSKNVYLDFDE